jgi:hypothetical protein
MHGGRLHRRGSIVAEVGHFARLALKKGISRRCEGGIGLGVEKGEQSDGAKKTGQLGQERAQVVVCGALERKGGTVRLVHRQGDAPMPLLQHGGDGKVPLARGV